MKTLQKNNHKGIVWLMSVLLSIVVIACLAACFIFRANASQKPQQELSINPTYPATEVGKTVDVALEGVCQNANVEWTFEDASQQIGDMENASSTTAVFTGKKIGSTNVKITTSETAEYAETEFNFEFVVGEPCTIEADTNVANLTDTEGSFVSHIDAITGQTVQFKATSQNENNHFVELKNEEELVFQDETQTYSFKPKGNVCLTGTSYLGFDFYTVEDIANASNDVSENGESSKYYPEFASYMNNNQVWYSHSQGAYNPAVADDVTSLDKNYVNNFVGGGESNVNNYLFLRIIGINQTYREGGTVNNGISLQAINALPNTYSFDSANNWWGDSDLRKSLNNSGSGVVSKLNKNFSICLADTQNYTYNPNSTNENKIDTTSDRLFVPSYSEMYKDNQNMSLWGNTWNGNSGTNTEGAVYNWYNDQNVSGTGSNRALSKFAYDNSGNKIGACWGRSTFTKKAGNTNVVNFNGSIDSYKANSTKLGVNICFSFVSKEAYACLSSDKTTLTFYYDFLKSERQSQGCTCYGMNSGEEIPGWYYDENRTKITTVDFDSSFSSFRPTTCFAWFVSMSSLLNISNFDNLNTANVTDMTYMFYLCENLTSLTLPRSFDTANVTCLSCMFYQCYNLTTITLPDSFNTANVTNTELMFYQCFKLTSLTLPDSFDITKVTKMDNMFNSCISLSTINCDKDWSTSTASSENMFLACTKIKGGNDTEFDSSTLDKSYARPDGKEKGYFTTSKPSYTLIGDAGIDYFVDEDNNEIEFVDGSYGDEVKIKPVVKNSYVVDSISDNGATSKSYELDTKGYFTLTLKFNGEISVKTLEAYACLSEDNSTLAFYFDNNKSSKSGTKYSMNIDEESPKWPKTFSNVVFDSSFKKYKPITCYKWFNYCDSLSNISGLENLDTSMVTDMRFMFYNCTNLATFALPSTFDTANVTNMSYMFYSCSKLTALTLSSSFNTANVANMSGLFYRCSNLTELTLSDSFNTGNVTDMSFMFSSCSKLKTLTLPSSFNTANVTDMSYMFSSSTSLTTIISDSDWSSTPWSEYMFTNCTNLKGGNGTTYNSSFTDNSYARPDGVQKGYFTKSKPSYTLSKDDGIDRLVDKDGKTITSVNGSYGDEVKIKPVVKNSYSVNTISDNGATPKSYELDTEGYFTLTLKFDGEISVKTLEAYACLSQDKTTLTFYCDNDKSKKTGTKYSMNAPSIKPEWSSLSFSNVVFDSEFKKYKPTTCYKWFYELASLLTISGLENLDTTKVADMSYMFYGCEKLQTLDASSFNTAKVTDMSYMFTLCSSLSTLTLPDSFNTTNVTDMSYMFAYCNCASLTTLTLPSSFNTTNVTNMSYMFYNCRNLTTLSLPSTFYTTNVTDMSYMFSQCSKLTTLTLPESFNTAKVKNMYSMFYCCQTLNTLTLPSSFKITSVTNMKQMFFQCEALTKIICDSDWSNSSASSDNMFGYCKKLVGGNGTTYNKDIVDKTYAKPDGVQKGYFTKSKASYTLSGDANIKCFEDKDGKTITSVNGNYGDEVKIKPIVKPSYGLSYGVNTILDNGATCKSYELDADGYFTLTLKFDGKISVTTLEAYACLSEDKATLTFYFDNAKSSKAGTKWSMNTDKQSPDWLRSFSNAVFDSGFKKYKPTTCYKWFNERTSLLSITGIENLDTTWVTNMSYMFYDCENLQTLDTSSFNTAKVTDMSYMFDSCYNLQTLNLSTFNTANVTNMRSMFESCSKLSNLTLPDSFNTANVTNMWCMFNSCQNLQTLTLPSTFNTAKVTTMRQMFSYCYKLTTLTLPASFDVGKVTYMDSMFSSCEALTKIICDSDWSSSTASSESMFSGCSNLKGGKGTTLSKTDKTYARPDGGTSRPGYFTASS